MANVTETKQSAADALRCAIENEAKARAALDKAAGAVRAALAAKNALIESAASGAAVTAADVRAAEEAARSAEIDAALAEQVHAGATKRRHVAQLARWHEEAQQLRQAAEAAAQALRAADAEIDRLAEPLRQAIAARNDLLFDLEAARSAAGFFNSQRDARRTTNPILAQKDSGADDPYIREAMRGSVHSWPAVKTVDGNAVALRLGLTIRRDF
jgi:hypothetical protein